MKPYVRVNDEFYNTFLAYSICTVQVHRANITCLNQMLKQQQQPPPPFTTVHNFTKKLFSSEWL